MPEALETVFLDPAARRYPVRFTFRALLLLEKEVDQPLDQVFAADRLSLRLFCAIVRAGLYGGRPEHICDDSQVSEIIEQCGGLPACTQPVVAALMAAMPEPEKDESGEGEGEAGAAAPGNLPG